MDLSDLWKQLSCRLMSSHVTAPVALHLKGRGYLQGGAKWPKIVSKLKNIKVDDQGQSHILHKIGWVFNLDGTFFTQPQTHSNKCGYLYLGIRTLLIKYMQDYIVGLRLLPSRDKGETKSLATAKRNIPVRSKLWEAGGIVKQVAPQPPRQSRAVQFRGSWIGI